MGRNPWLPVVAMHDQDIAAARKWWAEASNADKLRVWMAIQDMDGNPLAEIVSRFAQLGFEEIALKEIEAPND